MGLTRGAASVSRWLNSGTFPMNTKALIDTAVINSTTTGRKGLADRLFAHWFNRLVYAQIWEDPVVDLKALDLRPGAHILTISSGGCNALAYLAAQPGAVHAVDLNAAHLATLKLKAAALRHLPAYDDVLAFLGDASGRDNLGRYRQHIAPHLDAETRGYWEARSLSGRPRYHYFARHFYRHGLLGDFIALGHLLVRLFGGNLARLAEAGSLAEQRELFARHVAPAVNNRLLRWLANRPMALYSLGIPPAQFEALKQDAPEGMHALLIERLRRLACDYPIAGNCFAGQAFARRYDTTRQAALPMYLQAQHYATIRAGLDQLHTHHTTLTEFLREQPRESMDAYLFLDAQDWMDAAQLTALWREVTRTAVPGARVVFRSGGSTSPLEAVLPEDILDQWHTDPARNRALHARDRAAIYGGVHCYERL